MQAGKLRHRIQIQTFVEIAGPMGELVKDWSLYANRRASIQPISGNEFSRNQQIQPEVTHSVTLRYIDGLTPGNRIVHNNRGFEILSVLVPDNIKREMKLLCKEIPGNVTLSADSNGLQLEDGSPLNL